MLKITSGQFKGRTLVTPKVSTTRPTQTMVRQAVFNICQQEIEGASFLDLFAGSGACGLEALSRGAKHVTFVEKNRQALIALTTNIQALEVSQMVDVLRFDAKIALSKCQKRYDIIYIDPPYDLDVKKYLAEICSQDVLAPQGLIFLEQRHDPKLDPKIFEIEGLRLKNARRFATTMLYELIKS